MKIIYRKGDVFQSDAKHIAHGCNMQGKMGKGFAKAVKDNYPAAYNDYMRAYQEGMILGDIIISNVSNFLEERVIINCLTQFTYSSKPYIRNISYEAIQSCMTKINDYCIDYTVHEIHMPRIGASLGGGDWDKISQIIEECSTDFQPIVWEL
jgi:O-acetyl-ADP-ribose deacetylase (regulator of RNase III)